METQNPRALILLMSAVYFPTASTINLALSIASFPLFTYKFSSSAISYEPRFHAILSILTESVIPKYWNGHRIPRSIASGSLISEVMWPLKYFSISFPSILSGVAVSPSIT